MTRCETLGRTSSDMIERGDMRSASNASSMRCASDASSSSARLPPLVLPSPPKAEGKLTLGNVPVAFASSAALDPDGAGPAPTGSCLCYTALPAELCTSACGEQRLCTAGCNAAGDLARLFALSGDRRTLSARQHACCGVIGRMRRRHVSGVVQEAPYEARNDDASGRAPATQLHDRTPNGSAITAEMTT